ncbi:MAG: NAD(P)-dependent oxidoreductase [Bacteroidota bacterium]|nr:NAD(P)-dependent oxidoreductase [Bacteroidota bacterium]
MLVTGASGFIGSFYVDEALKRGWDVWAGIRRHSNRAFLTDPSIHLIDLNYGNGLQQQIEQHVAQYGKWECVIHCAGITKSPDEADFYNINYEYTKQLIDALRNSGNTPSIFIFMSSMAAYGPGDEKHYTPLRSDSTPQPNTAYGKSKLIAEQYLQSLPDFPYIILRPTGVYGPRERDYYVMAKMVQRGVDVALGFKPQLLNFIYIKDLVNVCFSAIESPLHNKDWFVADGDIYTSKAYTDIVKNVLHKKHVFRITFPLFVVHLISVFGALFCKVTGKPSLISPDKIRIMKQRNWTCDITPLERDLGFKASYNLQQGMEETIVWYKENGWL